MTRLGDTVRMEGVRVSTARATYVLLFLAVVVSAVIALMIALLAPPGPLAPSRTSAALTAGGDAMPLSTVGSMLAMLGAVTVGHDYRFGLLPAVLIAQPRRVVAVAGRLAVLALVAVALAGAVSLLAAGVCWGVGRSPAHDPVTLRVVGWHAGVCVLWAWLGAGLGWILRGTAAVVSLLLLGSLLVEPGIAVAAEARGTPGSVAAARWMPFAAARQALGRGLAAGPDTIGALAGTAVLAAVTAVVLGLACLLVQRRDV